MEADQAAFARLESLVKLLSQRVEYLENHVKVVEAENAALRREIDQMRKD
jgi:chaperonin cofactor prefoldin